MKVIESVPFGRLTWQGDRYALMCNDPHSLNDWEDGVYCNRFLVVPLVIYQWRTKESLDISFKECRDYDRAVYPHARMMTFSGPIKIEWGWNDKPLLHESDETDTLEEPDVIKNSMSLKWECGE